MSQPIAIIGTACRFPGGASSPSKLWNLLLNPTDVLTPFPPERLNLSKFYNEYSEQHGSTDVKGSSYLLAEDCRNFDAAFFRINPSEAEGMDPQQRILLETVFEAFESAGLTLENVSGSLTSVHVGLMNSDYSDIQLRDPETLQSHHATGTARSIMSNRLSYFFDLKGPSATIDTACSSSLVALHQAVQGLRTGDATLAVVAGANLILDPPMYIAESNLHMLSPDSRSRMWDSEANGYARGEGFAAIVLKPLHLALADNDAIDGVIRETGVNSDGRSAKGITNPSAAAQTSLIRETYRRAGLDSVRDRCQFFECHGTGTLAGDPIEARAIRDAFFPEPERKPRIQYSNEKLQVGSIKTVIGHTEGCAGLAGVLKAVLAIKHRTIPPNLLFKALNPEIEPFYTNMEVVTRPKPWPDTSGSPPRVSVNSFGFGGTNAHAIIEGLSAHTSSPRSSTAPAREEFVGPLVFSANSEPSLYAMVSAFTEHVRRNPTLNLEDAAWTLQQRRSLFDKRVSFSGANKERLMQFLNRFVTDSASSGSALADARIHRITQDPGILGIFTGQGAQWATMGRGLYHSSEEFRDCIRLCENTLAALPDPPSWSLVAELLAADAQSKVSEAAVCQPLCTAIQLGMIALLCKAGIRLSAVVGHSSGEIAAVYATGAITLAAAMQISYYRGFYAKLARGKGGQAGKMIAVGLSFDDAVVLCSDDQFHERIVVAASNSPGSVTISGDEDAIHELKAQLDEQGTFARILHTDTAYHSQHMLPCVVPYLSALQACKIEVSQPRPECIWSSSVYGDPYHDDRSSLADQYWVDNMCNPVLFSQALETSMWNAGPYDMIFEIGPHPALKGPVEQTFKAILGAGPPYAGLMRRGDDETEAFSGAMGYAWTILGPKHVNFDGYRDAFGLSPVPMSKDLPSYTWDHEKPFWRESRISRRFRLLEERSHELLGRKVPDCSDDRPRWRNILRNGEISWLKQHVFQGQILFPGAGYVVLALEAARHLASSRPVALFEIQDVVLSRAIVIPENEAGIEIAFSCTVLETMDSDKQLLADFSCSFCNDEKSAAGLVQACSGRMRLVFEQPSCVKLPPRPPQSEDMANVAIDRFYSAMHNVGLEYKGLFHGLKSAKRSSGSASCNASWHEHDVGPAYLIHPGILDVAFQALYVAFSSPASGNIWAAYLPVRIEKLSICGQTIPSDGLFDFDIDSFVDTASSTLLSGDIHVYDKSTQSSLVQVEGIAMQAMSEPAPENDKHVFASTVWVKDIASGPTPKALGLTLQDDNYLVDALDRVSLYYWQKLLRDLTSEQAQNCKPYHQLMLDATRSAIKATQEGKHPVARPDWLQDSLETIECVSLPYQDRADMRLIHAVGENLHSVLTTDMQMLQVLLQENLLNQFYREGYGLDIINDAMAETIRQITMRNPHSEILEIGAGTGGTTRNVLDTVNECFSSYTYTDVSSGFFEKAAEKFAEHRSKIIFKILNIEKDVESQGFVQGKYDIILASNVLHATRSLRTTMENARSLLRPGGYLLIMEITGVQIFRSRFIMGGLPGWWYGASEGRDQTPAISELEWDELLQESGFSGVDHILKDMEDESRHSFSLIVTQALDQQYATLREPLLHIRELEVPENLFIIGGKTLAGARIVKEVQKLLMPWKTSLRVVPEIERLPDRLPPHCQILVLQELDQPIFTEEMTKRRWTALQRLFSSASVVLWVTSGRFSRSPEENMMVGLGRTFEAEIPSLKLQFLDLDCDHRTHTGDANTITNTFLRLRIHAHAASVDNNGPTSIEPEIRMIGNECWVPRVQAHFNLNKRANSSRRCIWQVVQTREEAVGLHPGKNGLELRVRSDCATERVMPGTVTMQTQHTVLLAASEKASIYLCTGIRKDSNETVMTLSPHNTSVLRLPENRLLSVNISPTGGLLTRLLTVGLRLLLCSIETLLPSQGSIVFHELPEPLALILAARAAKAARVMVFTTFARPESSVYIQLIQTSTLRALRRSLPHEVTALVDFSSSASNRLPSAAVPTASILLVDDIMRNLNDPINASHLPLDGEEKIVTVAGTMGKLLTIDGFEACVGKANAPNLLSVTDWTSSSSAKVIMQPLTTTGLLSPDKTYLLIGMTGEVGLSLSRWMVVNGARNIALASRNPKISPAWLEEMGKTADIKIFQADVAQRSSVHAMLETIRATMPPIAGVCNASMVLADKLFLNMDVESLETCLKPKVDGSRILNDALGNEDLDFFIFFSSLASIYGDGGQSNYHAANMYMSGLAAQRREKGLAASIMHIGLLTDVGYVARNGQALEERLRRLFFMPLSEEDLHHAFAEAILASNPDSNHEPELILGIEPFHKSEHAVNRPFWEHNPRMSHFVSLATAQPNFTQTGSSVNMAQELESAPDESYSLKVLTDAFCRKLESMMQLPSGSADPNIPLIDLGCDSLLAIEIRGWFLKELRVDVPVLKVLSGDSISDLCTDATRRHMAIKLSTGADLGQKSGTSTSEPSDDSVSSDGRDVVQTFTESSAVSHTSSEVSSSQMEHSLRAFTDCLLDTQDITTTSSSMIPTSENSEDYKQKEPLSILHTHPASFAQSRLWFLSTYLQDKKTYNVTVAYDVKGPLNKMHMELAITSVFRRHSALRTCFFEDDGGTVMQGILAESSWKPKIIEGGNDNKVQDEFEALRNTAWDLEHGRTFDVTILSLDSGRNVVIFGYHHIVMDGVSWHVILQELDLAYQSKRLPAAQSYYEYSNAILHDHSEGTFNDDLLFWRKQHDPLPSVTPLLPMASVTERRRLDHYTSHVATRKLDSNINKRVKQAARHCQATPFHFHLAVYQTLLARLLQHSDLCIGVSDANRSHDGHQRTVGFFLNLLPVRFNVITAESFEKLVRETSKRMLAALSHSRVPFDSILDVLLVPRSPNHSPLFQVAINYRMGDLLERPMGDCTLLFSSAEDAKNPYDLSLTVTEQTNGTCMLELIGQGQLYTERVVERLADSYVYLLEKLSSDPKIAISDCPVAPPEVTKAVIELGRGSRLNFDWPSTLIHRFHDVAREHAHEPAMVDQAGTLTYSELSDMANEISSEILASRIQHGTSVAVLCHPSRFSTAAMLSVLACGLVYVPLDTRHPHTRHVAILQDCRAQLILHQNKTANEVGKLFEACNPKYGVIDVESPKSPSPDVHYQPYSDLAQPNQPAFILYTSGSTGAPKGIVLSQSNFRNHLALKVHELAMGQERVLQQSHLGFDMAIVQTFCALANGGTLIVAANDLRGDPVELSKLMLEQQVTFTIATPSEYSMMMLYGREYLDQCSAWRQACMGGEPVTKELIQQFRDLQHSPGMRFTNCYGPTEITAAATFQRVWLHSEAVEVAEGQSIVGKAIPNYSVYILSSTNDVLPLNSTGEICIAGAGVALGYLERPNENAAKFVNDPYATLTDHSNGMGRMYRTGDKGRMLEDGRIVFMGRIDDDNQIKLNGQRIELDGVASQILHASQGKFVNATVTVRGEPKFLVAHVVFAPGYMIPAITIPLDNLPLTINGKVDRRQLSQMPLPVDVSSNEEKTTTSLTLVEAELRLLWLQVLPADCTINSESDFFLCGGNSVMLVKLQSSIKTSMSVVASVAQLYSASTLREMATLLSAERSGPLSISEKVDWFAETKFDETKPLNGRMVSRSAASKSAIQVVLTGSTSFVGKTLLRLLVQHPLVAAVHCIAVPAEDKGAFSGQKKTIVYTGSLAHETLGLNEADRAALLDSADVIIHAGSSGHCLNRYSSLRKPNLGSTRFLAELAISCGIPFHYISSGRVTLLSGRMDCPPRSVAESFPNEDGLEGFTSSKWASERLLQNCARRAGLNVVIHRPCAPIGPEAPSEDALNSLLAFSATMRAVPRFDNFDGYLDFKSVTEIGEDIIREIFAAPGSDTQPIRFVHHSSNRKLPVADLQKHMQIAHGVECDEISVNEWIKRADAAGIEPCIASYLESVVNKEEILQFPYLGSQT
ncbi:putative Hybrid PKS-NRPS [Seiridium cardinale]|uniref:Hybrid PKS-NRPS n=1 Tax=Seiridium cardinale TaxID=138064 RepID=A0ABR2Y8H6_9PEZI